jgi:hypothetical protein
MLIVCVPMIKFPHIQPELQQSRQTNVMIKVHYYKIILSFYIKTNHELSR